MILVGEYLIETDQFGMVNNFVCKLKAVKN